MVSTLQSLKIEEIKNIGILLCLSAREEIGALSVAHYFEAYDPQVVISFDSCFVSDAVCRRARNVGNIVLSGGPVICYDPTFNNELNQSIIEIAHSANINIQRYANIYPGRGLNSTWLSSRANKCIITSILLPTRYMHSPYEMCSVEDYNALKKLIACIINYYNSM